MRYTCQEKTYTLHLKGEHWKVKLAATRRHTPCTWMGTRDNLRLSTSGRFNSQMFFSCSSLRNLSGHAFLVWQVASLPLAQVNRCRWLHWYETGFSVGYKHCTEPCLDSPVWAPVVSSGAVLTDTHLVAAVVPLLALHVHSVLVRAHVWEKQHVTHD